MMVNYRVLSSVNLDLRLVNSNFIRIPEDSGELFQGHGSRIGKIEPYNQTSNKGEAYEKKVVLPAHVPEELSLEFASPEIGHLTHANAVGAAVVYTMLLSANTDIAAQ